MSSGWYSHTMAEGEKKLLKTGAPGINGMLVSWGLQQTRLRPDGAEATSASSIFVGNSSR